MNSLFHIKQVHLDGLYLRLVHTVRFFVNAIAMKNWVVWMLMRLRCIFVCVMSHLHGVHTHSVDSDVQFQYMYLYRLQSHHVNKQP